MKSLKNTYHFVFPVKDYSRLIRAKVSIVLNSYKIQNKRFFAEFILGIFNAPSIHSTNVFEMQYVKNIFKGFIYLLFFLSADFGFAQNLPVLECEPGWTWLYPTPEGYSHKCCFKTKNGIMIYDDINSIFDEVSTDFKGYLGIVSSDDGNNWNYFLCTTDSLCPFSGFDLSTLQFVNDSIGYVIYKYDSIISLTNPNSMRNSRTMRTTDGGYSWHAINDKMFADSNRDIYYFHMFTPQNGIVANALEIYSSLYENIIWSTNDSGKSWNKIRIDSMNSYETGIYYYDFMHGLVEITTMISYNDPFEPLYSYQISTTNGGMSWDTFNIESPPFYSINKFDSLFRQTNCIFTDSLNGIGFYSTDTILYQLERTTNGGKTWQLCPTQIVPNNDSMWVTFQGNCKES